MKKNMKSSIHLTAAATVLAAMQCAGGLVAHAQTTGTVDFTTHIEQIDGFGFADPFGRAD